MDEIGAIVIETLARYSKEGSAGLDPDTRLDSLQMDSLDTLEAVMHIEEKLGIEIDPGEFSACGSIADVISVVNRAAAN